MTKEIEKIDIVGTSEGHISLTDVVMKLNELIEVVNSLTKDESNKEPK